MRRVVHSVWSTMLLVSYQNVSNGNDITTVTTRCRQTAPVRMRSFFPNDFDIFTVGSFYSRCEWKLFLIFWMVWTRLEMIQGTFRNNRMIERNRDREWKLMAAVGSYLKTPINIHISESWLSKYEILTTRSSGRLVAERKQYIYLCQHDRIAMSEAFRRHHVCSTQWEISTPSRRKNVVAS